MSLKVKHSYKALLRAVNVAFKNDNTMRQSALTRIRSEYLENANAEGPELRQKLQFAKDVAYILRSNVVQGVAEGDSKVFKLQVTKDTELGDNDSRFTGTHTGSPAGGCCGGR